MYTRFIILIQPSQYIEVPDFISHICIGIRGVKYGYIQSCWYQYSFCPPVSLTPATSTRLVGCWVVIWICSSRIFQWGRLWSSPSPPRVSLALVGHLCSLPPLTLGVSCSTAPSWAFGMGGTLPTNCEDPELADPVTCMGKLSCYWVGMHCLHLAWAAILHWHPSSSNKGTTSKFTDLPIHSAKVSARCEHMAKAASFMRPWCPCLS